MSARVLPFSEIGIADVARVGGKNASLGEMIRRLHGAGVRVPDGFATTADAFHEHLAQGGLDRKIAARLSSLDIRDVPALAAAGADIRRWILDSPLPSDFADELRTAYARLDDGLVKDLSFAVRSSATAEDLPEASFAGQQETLLNVRGIDVLLEAVRRVFASLYTDRAIAYRTHHGFDHARVALSAGVQRMVRTDIGVSGVLFTLDTESGFRDVVLINAAWGLGETVVQGAVDPDEFCVHKPTLAKNFRPIVRRSLGRKQIHMTYGGGTHRTRTLETADADRQRFCLSDDEVLELARMGVAIEAHYGRPMDVEWGKDGADGKLYILQARPETVRSRASANRLERYHLKRRSDVVASGRAIGSRIGAGPARVVAGVEALDSVQPGDVLVTDMTDPDWEPVMKRAAAIVTNRGGRTCHAAIVARELGIPAIVGCGNATRLISDGRPVTASCAEGETGFVYRGQLDFSVETIDTGEMPALPVKMMMNIGNPERAFDFQTLPNDGVGLARIEFIIAREIGVHPRALLDPGSLPKALNDEIAPRLHGYGSPVDFYIGKLAEGIATLAAAFYPKPVIVRFSDFKSNEYANLIGGDRYEPREENPMLGFRGAARYLADEFRECFALECRAVRRVREEMGLTNVEVMVPFVRTVDECQAVVERMAENGLARGQQGLRVIMMCEIPSNALLAESFLEHVDGFSIGSNDLTQLTLGIDRDSALVAAQFDERNEAVKALLSRAIEACRRQKKYIGICGQGPSDHPDLARWLLDQGIDSLSLNPDSVIGTWLFLARADHP